MYNILENHNDLSSYLSTQSDTCSSSLYMFLFSEQSLLTTSSTGGFSFSFSSVRHKICKRSDRLKDRTIELLCGTEFLQELMFTDQRFFVFFLLGINFCDLQKVLDKSLIMFLILLSTCNGNTYFQTIFLVYVP